MVVKCQKESKNQNIDKHKNQGQFEIEPLCDHASSLPVCFSFGIFESWYRYTICQAWI